MAIDTIPPWVRGPNVEAALASGGAVGENAARLQTGREESSARLAQDAIQHNQQLQMESARLSQQEHLAQMETQARKEIAEQNQLREQQRQAITAAYHQAQIGMEKGRLEQQQAVAEAKAQNAAQAFQREQAFAKDVASGIPVMEAYQRNPVSASVLNAIGRTQLKETGESKPVIREGRYPIVRIDPKTGESKVVYTPKGAAPEEVMGAAAPQSNAAPSGKMWGGAGMIRGGLTAPKSSKPSIPKAGEVFNGHKFKGGDPSDADNWEEVGEGE